MMKGMSNLWRREGERAAGQRSMPRRATVTSFDPARYAAKVLIQPEGFETGFLPIASPWVGNGWGLVCPPTPGDEVDVHFQEGGKNAAYISLRFFGSKAIPPNALSGEFMLQHANGQRLKFHNDGTIEVLCFNDINIQCFGNVNGTATNWNLTGNVFVDGNIVATGDISDQNNAHGTVGAFRSTYDIHTHGGVTPGGANTAVPNQTV